MHNHSVRFRNLLAGLVATVSPLCIAFTSAHAQTAVTGTISSFPYVIDGTTHGAGLYVVTAPLNSSATSGALIYISVPNVTIDFQNYSISASGDNSGQGAVGIFIYVPSTPSNAVTNNITIQNGTIQNCGIGIQLVGSNGSTPNINNVRIDNMRVTNCSQYGIYAGGALTACLINNCQIFNIGLTTFAQNSCGIFFGGTNSTIQGCTVNNIVAGSGYASTCIATSNQCVLRQNQVGNATFGLNGGGIYQDNLASGFTTSGEEAFVPGYTNGGGNVANSSQ